MAHTQSEQLKRIQGKAQHAFEQANPAIWKNIQGQPTKIQAVKDIQDRTQTLTQRMQDHVAQHRSNWVGREAVRLLEEHGHLVLEYPRPSWLSDLPANFSFVEEARRRVQSRIEGRLTRIATAGKRMEARSVDLREMSLQSKPLQAEVQKVIGRTQIVRDKARAHYASSREGWLQKAAARGSDNPKIEVFQRQRDRMARIDQAGEQLIRQLFREHDRTLPEVKEKTLVQDFNQVMG